MEKVLFNCAAAWLIPGAGHFLLKRFWEAGLLFVSCAVLIIIGLKLNGLYYPGSAADFGIMYWLHQIAAAGNAVFLPLNLLFNKGISSKEAIAAFSSANFEYGGRCFALAGLIDFLAIINVYDQTLRRIVSK